MRRFFVSGNFCIFVERICMNMKKIIALAVAFAGMNMAAADFVEKDVRVSN